MYNQNLWIAGKSADFYGSRCENVNSEILSDQTNMKGVPAVGGF